MGLISKLLREPVLHFLLLGSGLYAAAALHARTTDPQRIAVTDAVVSRLADRYTQQFGAPPPPDRLAYLVDRYVQDEALYRQGMAMGLANDDEIVRRRIIQKMEFLGEGDADAGEPTEQQLRSHYLAHSGRYRLPERISFRHMYFSPDQSGDAAARARAAATLARLNASPSTATLAGDAFPDRQNFALVDRDEVERIFGQGEFAGALFASADGRWGGPIRSGYGWHLVRIDAREAPRVPDFAAVAEDVRTDWRSHREALLKQQALNRIIGQYQVVRDDHAGSGTARK